MSGRDIRFTFGGITLSANDYSITAKNKIIQVAMASNIIRTVSAGKAATQVKIHGKLPAAESAQLLSSLDAYVGGDPDYLLLDGTGYNNAILDAVTVTPSKSEGFAQYTLELHF